MQTGGSQRVERVAKETKGVGATRWLANAMPRLAAGVVAALAGAIAACSPSESASPASGQGISAAPLSSSTLDIDGDGEVTTHSDAMLIMRYTSGIRGDALVKGAVSSDCERCTPEEIGKYIESL